MAPGLGSTPLAMKTLGDEDLWCPWLHEKLNWRGFLCVFISLSLSLSRSHALSLSLSFSLSRALALSLSRSLKNDAWSNQREGEVFVQQGRPPQSTATKPE